ncbi:unnamed protein product [Phytophthora lilii]|uniref:Unnamed protein product n=1 Tax=Phytophthora lilii TaxID=2077276 RepID=A0A9W6TZS6_9STRA|nr:unnamed protein product [Phytophthora lilii]
MQRNDTLHATAEYQSRVPQSWYALFTHAFTPSLTPSWVEVASFANLPRRAQVAGVHDARPQPAERRVAAVAAARAVAAAADGAGRAPPTWPVARCGTDGHRRVSGARRAAAVRRRIRALRRRRAGARAELSVRQAQRIATVQRQLLSVVNERVKITSEALQGVRVIKFYARELSVANCVHKIRATEVSLIRKLHLYTVSNSVLLFLTPVFLSGSTLGLYVLLHGAISVTDAFTLVALVNICRAVVYEFTTALSALSLARSSFARIDEFLASEEFEADTRPSNSGAGHIHVLNAHAEWTSLWDGYTEPSSDVVSEFTGMDDVSVCSNTSAPSAVLLPEFSRFALKGMSLDIEPSSLVMIVATVGSGKSSFLLALLGEMMLRSGELEVHGDISYVSQESWIRNSSVKSNILFESAFDADRYERVLQASQLLLDLHALPNGDQTEIGEKGINLSGGHKARVAIARASYHLYYDILLLDDPLSAVDAHVAHSIFNEGIMGLARNKTRLLVLNSHYDLLTRADKIVVFQQGRIVCDGTYKEVVAQFPEFRYDNKIDGSDGRNVAENDTTTTDTGNLVKEEERATGTVGGRVYRAYFDETGPTALPCIFPFSFSTNSRNRIFRVKYFKKYKNDNFQKKQVPESVKELSARYLTESDPFTPWFDSEFERADDKKKYVSLKDIFEIYKRSYLYENLSKADKRSQNYRWFIGLINSHHTLKLFYKEDLKLSQTTRVRNILVGYKLKEEEYKNLNKL